MHLPQGAYPTRHTGRPAFGRYGAKWRAAATFGPSIKCGTAFAGRRFAMLRPRHGSFCRPCILPGTFCRVLHFAPAISAARQLLPVSGLCGSSRPVRGSRQNRGRFGHLHIFTASSRHLQAFSAIFRHLPNLTLASSSFAVRKSFAVSRHLPASSRLRRSTENDANVYAHEWPGEPGPVFSYWQG